MSTEWKCVDYQGNLAITLGWWPNWSEPYNERLLYVLKDVTTANRPDLLDTYWDIIPENAGFWRWSPNGRSRRQIVRESDIQSIVERKAICKPRKGRDYDWRWDRGKWNRDYRN